MTEQVDASGDRDRDATKAGETTRTIVRYDLLTWANMVDLYRAYPGYEGPVSRLKEAGL